MTVVTPINVSDITRAVVDQLKRDTRLANVAVSRSEEVNLDPAVCPWIGVYRLSVQYPQRQLAAVAGFRSQLVRMTLLVTAADYASGEACEDATERLVCDAISALLSDTTLAGTVQFLDEFSVNYTDYTREGGVYMQTAAVEFVAVTNTTITGG